VVDELIARRLKAERRAHVTREVIETVLLTAVVFLVVHFAVQTSLVVGPSMEPGMHGSDPSSNSVGDRLLVNRVAYVLGGPQRGDVIIFQRHHMPVSGDLQGCSLDEGSSGRFMTCDLVKRVVAMPGDTVAITPTQVIVDGKVLHEPYIQVPAGAAQNPLVWPTHKLGPNQYYVLGDNRLNSEDSRFFGPVPRQDIVGRVVLVFWPLNHLHWLQSYSGVYAGLQQH
jgi:signal peptidase I